MTKSPQIFVVVPLRLASTRLPKKVFAQIADKPMMVHTLQRVREAFRGAAQVEIIAAVDADETVHLLKKYFPDLRCVFTAPEIPSGTDRVYAAIQQLRGEYMDLNQNLKGIINVQADVPFLGTNLLREMASFMITNEEGYDMCTASLPWPETLDYSDRNHVKVLLNKQRHAIYFSRFPIPYSRIESFSELKPKADLHVGIYGYSLDALTKFCIQPPTFIDQAESLEQLRALYLGMKIRVFKAEEKENESFRGIDTPADLEWASKFISG